jgi:hypothetical protein
MAKYVPPQKRKDAKSSNSPPSLTSENISLSGLATAKKFVQNFDHESSMSGISKATSRATFSGVMSEEANTTVHERYFISKAFEETKQGGSLCLQFLFSAATRKCKPRPEYQSLDLVQSNADFWLHKLSETMGSITLETRIYTESWNPRIEVHIVDVGDRAELKNFIMSSGFLEKSISNRLMHSASVDGEVVIVVEANSPDGRSKVQILIRTFYYLCLWMLDVSDNL